MLGAGAIFKVYWSQIDDLRIKWIDRFSIIAKSKGLLWKNVNKFATLQKELGVSLNELHDLVNKTLKLDVYTLDDILSILDIELVEFQDIFLSANTKGMTTFILRNRALHVLQGAALVQGNLFHKAK